LVAPIADEQQTREVDALSPQNNERSPNFGTSPGPSSFASEVNAPAGPISLVRRQ
jgi:hypothetical protein